MGLSVSAPNHLGCDDLGFPPGGIRGNNVLEIDAQSPLAELLLIEEMPSLDIGAPFGGNKMPAEAIILRSKFLLIPTFDISLDHFLGLESDHVNLLVGLSFLFLGTVNLLVVLSC